MWKFISYALVVVTLFTGCVSPLQKRDKIKRKVEKLVRLYALDRDTVTTVKLDTVVKLQTITIPEIVSDTQFIWGYKDTIITYQDAGIETMMKFVHDTIKIKTTVLKRDTVVQYRDVVKTVIKTVPISVEPEAPKKKCKIPLLGIPCWYIWLPFVLLLIFLIGRGGIKLYKEWKS